MVQVFFESKGYAEGVALFPNEETYIACVPSLIKLSKEQGYKLVTESIQDPEVFILKRDEGDGRFSDIIGVYWTRENAEQAAKDLELDPSEYVIDETFRIV